MASPTHKVVATTGTYKGHDGNEKKRYTQCGIAFTDDQGRISIKLDAVPVTPEWSGWLSLFPMDDDRQEARQPRQERPATRPAPARRAPPPGTIQHPPPESYQEGMEDDGIPFN